MLAAALLTSALVVGCARDTGSTPPAAGGGEAGAQCARNSAPPAATGAAATPAPIAPNADASALKVALAYDIGGRGDLSFNDAAAAGLAQAIDELSLVEGNTREVAAAENESPDAAATRLRQLVADGFDPIIAVGFKYAEPLRVVAAENPNVRFAIIDDDTVDLPNVTPLVFAEEEGSFLVGAAAALKTQACKIGFVGGVETPLIQKFEAGYVAGAQAVAPDIEIDVDYLTPAGDFSGFADPAKASVVTNGQLDAGSDIIYHASGASGQGVFEAVHAASTPEDPKYAIGVDSDQYQTVAPPINEVIMTSMLKRVDVAVFNYINAVAAGDLGVLPERFDLAADGVGYSTSGGMIDDITDELDAYKAAIISGEITVPATP
ncbi:BMP family lipoprotein [Pseudonocardia nigra]|uniref:BMP family lipoprotein n=1 Tax=Pseudonocardia nigra TaxID=1921578 RepID=UPI0027E3322F|nr:BMP family ABC transporter substrate-binding protein [Pseudonocardia nigra]